MTLHDNESAKSIKPGDILDLNPRHAFIFPNTAHLKPPVTVMEVREGSYCQTGILLSVKDSRGKWAVLDAGWFYKSRDKQTNGQCSVPPISGDDSDRRLHGN